jgi:tRNA-dihydrouridine synthase
MIGRAALGHPWLFDDEHDLLEAAARAEREEQIVREHLDLIAAWFSPRDALIQVKKQLAAYIAGAPGARTLRTELFAQSTVAAALDVYERWREAAAGCESDGSDDRVASRAIAATV